MSEMTEPGAPASGPEETSPAEEVSPEERERILELRQAGYGTRKIARCLGRNRKTVQRVLTAHAPERSRRPPTPLASSKLDRFRELIQQKIQLRLSTTRILREIRESGYTGGRSILAEHCRALRAEIRTQSRTGVKRRFETAPGLETQLDWSPYIVKLATKPTSVHAFSATLCYSRKKHIRFYLDERESTLLEAHVYSFADFGGHTRRLVYDRMSTVVLGHVGPDRKPLWHPRFQDFSKYYGFDAFLCRRADPDRKGKVERPFRHLEEDFLRGSEFDSLEHLNERVRSWLDHIANGRPHGTTGLVPDEAFQAERDLLVRLPDVPYLACDEEPRQVDNDSTLSVAGTSYTVPSELANRTAMVRLYAEEFHVLDAGGRVVMRRRYVAPADKGKLQIDPAHYEGLGRRRPAASGGELEDAFVRRFPGLVPLLDGIKLRMKSIAHIHVRALLRLAARYGEAPFSEAAGRAQTYRRFDAHAVRRILERSFPLPPEEPPHSLTAAARVSVLLGDVDGGSLDGFADLDTRAAGPLGPTQEAPAPGALPSEGSHGQK